MINNLTTRSTPLTTDDIGCESFLFEVLMKCETECEMCDNDIIYSDEDTSICNDIVEGQYIEFKTIQCDKCGHHQRVY